jgi:hypothetical protein
LVLSFKKEQSFPADECLERINEVHNTPRRPMQMPPTEPQNAWVRRVLAVDIGLASGAGSGLSAPGNAAKAWGEARAAALAALTSLETAVRKSMHPGRDRAITSIRAIRANLTEKPSTLRQVEELVRYIRGDDVVVAVERPNVFSVAVRVRQPLTQALTRLKEHFISEGTA